jgi:hypothetical protein
MSTLLTYDETAKTYSGTVSVYDSYYVNAGTCAITIRLDDEGKLLSILLSYSITKEGVNNYGNLSINNVNKTYTITLTMVPDGVATITIPEEAKNNIELCDAIYEAMNDDNLGYQMVINNNGTTETYTFERSKQFEKDMLVEGYVKIKRESSSEGTSYLAAIVGNSYPSTYYKYEGNDSDGWQRTTLGNSYLGWYNAENDLMDCVEDTTIDYSAYYNKINSLYDIYYIRFNEYFNYYVASDRELALFKNNQSTNSSQISIRELITLFNHTDGTNTYTKQFIIGKWVKENEESQFENLGTCTVTITLDNDGNLSTIALNYSITEDSATSTYSLTLTVGSYSVELPEVDDNDAE